VIVSSVALYTWMQKKDRDGAGSWLAGLKTPEGQKMTRFSALLIGVLIALLALGALFAGTATPSG
jgi:ribose transport system permease protein